MRALFVLVSLSPLLAACGSTNISPGPSPPPSGPPAPGVVTVTAGGVSPQVVHVFFERKVTFVNADAQPHAFYSDVHPAHASCGGVLNIGTLQPGQQREVTGLPLDACLFHEEGNPADTRFQGILIIH